LVILIDFIVYFIVNLMRFVIILIKLLCMYLCMHTFPSTLDYNFFIQLSPTLTKLCHIKRDYLVHIGLCSKCPTSAETHAFRRLRKSFIPLLIVVYGK